MCSLLLNKERLWIAVGMFPVIKTGFSFPQTFTDSGFKKELLETALLLNELLRKKN